MQYKQQNRSEEAAMKELMKKFEVLSYKS